MKQRFTTILLVLVAAAIFCTLLIFSGHAAIVVAVAGLGVVGGLMSKNLNSDIMRMNIVGLNKIFVMLLLLITVINNVSNAQNSAVWTGPNGFTSSLGSRYLGDQIGSSGWNYTYYVGTGNQVNNVRVGVTYNGTTWTYYGPGSYGPWTPGSNYSVTQDIGAFRCSQTGSCYVVGQALDAFGSWSIGGNNSWNQSAVFNSSNSAYFTVSALSNPTSPNATCDAASSTTVNLSWAQWNSKNIFILRNTTNSFTDPVQGTTYTDGATYGGATVIKHSQGGTSLADATASSGTTYYYKIYSENFSYYSSGTVVGPVTTLPATPGTISGVTAQCSGATGQTYSVSSVTGATSYTWAVPTGWTITAGSTSNSITVTAGTSGQNGNITCKANDACGSSSNSTLAVTVNALPTISGTLSICGTGTTTLTGSGTAAASTPWSSASTGVATVSGASTTGTVTGVTAGTTNITYTDNHGCTSAASTVTVNALPTISGTLSICGTGTTTLTGSGTAAASTPWSSASTAVATVSGASTTGTVTGATAGTSNITYTDNHGCTSAASTVTVNGLPTINTQPTSPAAVSYGSGTATFTVAASGAGLNYTWYESTNGGSTWSSALTNTGYYSGATTANLVISAPPYSMNGYKYKCTVGGTCTPSVTTDGTATLTVTTNTITTGTISPTTYCAGSSISVPFTCNPSSYFTSGSCIFTAYLYTDNSYTVGTRTTIGSVTSNGGSSYTINGTVSSSVISGSTYYVRVESASPAVIGSAFGTPLTVYSVFTSGTISSTGQTICYNSSPSTTIGSSIVSSGGDGSIAYQWQSATDAAFTQNLTTLSSSNSATYTPSGTLTATTYYRRQAKDGTCNTTFTSSTNYWTVTVNSNFTSGTISNTGQTICYNTTPSTTIGSSIASSGGDGSITYQWQSSLNGSFTDAVTIGSSNSATLTGATIGALTATTTFRRQAHDGTCNTGFTTSTGTWVVTVDANFTSGTISSTGQTICYNTIPRTTIGSSIASGGGDGSITYQWQSSLNGTFSDAVTVGSSNSATLTGATIGSLTATTTFRRQAHDGTCNTGFTSSTGTWVVTVDANFTAGAITTTGQTICYNTSPSTTIGSSTASTGGDGSITYQWQSSLNGTFSDAVTIGSSNSATLTGATIGALTATKTFRRQAHDGTCNTSFSTSSGTWVVTVNPNFTAGSIPNTGQNICYNGNPSQITSSTIASGGDGNITYKWQLSLNGSTYSDISNSNSSNYTPPAGLTSSTYYQRLAKDGTCNTTFTSATGGPWLVSLNQSNSSSGYYSGWSTGNNDHTTGFDGWSLTQVGSPWSGCFIGSSGTGIDIGGSSFGLYANTNNTASADRTITGNMSVNQTISFNQLYQSGLNGGTVGFSLWNSSNQNLMEMWSVSGAGFMINDNAGSHTSNISHTNSLMNISIEYTSAISNGTYALAVTISGVTYNFTGTFINEGGGTAQVPVKIRFFNFNGGSSVNYYINSLSSNSPMITTQPSTSSQSVCSTPGATALSVTAAGTVSSYQWYYSSTISNSGGTLISGATSATYTPAYISGQTYGTGYYYYCVVTGSCTSVTSNTSGAITINANPTAITLTPTSNCTNSTIEILTGVQTGPSYQLWNASGPYFTAQTGAGSALTWSGVAVGTGYYVVVTNSSGCTYTSGTTSISSTAVASFTATGTTICTTPGGNGVITTSTGTDATVTYQLYNSGNATVGSSQTGNGSALSWTSLSAGTYHIYAYNGSSCNTTLYSIVVGTYSNPSAPSVTNGSNCGTGTVALSATGTTLKWYSDAGLSTQVQTGTSYTTPSLSSTTSYYVTQTDGNSCVSPGSTVTATINTVPSTPSGSDNTVTYDGSTHYASATAASGSTVDFYAASSGGSALVSGSGTTTNTSTSTNAGTYSYYAQARNTTTGCISAARQLVTLAINKVHLTVTADAKSKTFDNATYSAGYSSTITGFVNSENAGVVTGVPSYSGTAIAATAVGAYTITPALNTLSATNYDFTTFTNGTLNINAGTAGVWMGYTSTDYTNAANWANDAVPTASDNVTINSGTTYAPTLSGTGASHNLTIGSSATLTVTGTLSIAGNISNSGTLIASAGTLTLNGSSAQTVSGSFTVQNITVNNTAGVSLGNTSTDTVYLTGVYTPTAGTLTTNGRLVLVSNATGTASVAAGTGTYISGVVTVQRYHSNKRAWMMMSAPLSMNGLTKTSTFNGSIYNNWQQQTYITAPPSIANTTNGLDAAINNTYGILRWIGTGWGRVLNTKNDTSLIGDQGGSVANNKPFLLYIRGDRSITPALGGTSSTAVTLKACGALQTGTKTFDLSNNSSAYALIANPYAAPISLDQFLAENTGLKTGGNTYFYYWDPNNSTSGGYTTAIYNGSSWTTPSGLNGGNTQPLYIQSGQAFIVTKNGQNTITFNETQKSTNHSSNTVFGNNTATALVKVDLSNGANYIDGVLGMYNNNYSTAVVPYTEDANKLWGNEEGVAIARTGTNLSVEARPEIVNDDTMFLYMNRMVAGNTYDFTVTGTNIASNITGTLVDKYLNKNTVLDLTASTKVSFVVDTAAAAKSATRFMIVFNAKAPLYVSEIKIKASVKAKSAVIDWSVVTEKDVKTYTVEHSTNGAEFAAINTTSAKNISNSNYSYTDINANTGDNYYRIKAINKDGSVQYSSIAKVTIGDRREGISIYPNPIVGKTMNVQFSNIAAGTYALSMTNANGQQVMEQSLQHAGGSVTETVQLPSTLASGIYQLRIFGNGGSYTETVIVK